MQRDRNEELNHVQGKNYAAGVMPVCVCDGVQYVLLGLQPKVSGRISSLLPDKSASPGVCCLFWGWQDRGDLDEEDSAAREGSEESAGLLGNREQIREHLLATPASRILPQLFVLNLGEFTAGEMASVQDIFQRKRWFGKERLPKACREMCMVAWFSVSDLRVACERKDAMAPGMVEGQRLRGFLHRWWRGPHVWEALQYAGDLPVYPCFVGLFNCAICEVFLSAKDLRWDTGICNACYKAAKRLR
jgi:hypothetical protein